MKKITRAEFLRLSAAAGLVLAGCGESRQRGAPAVVRRLRQPNILLLLTDQERSWTDLPLELELPQRQRLAARGLSFVQYHANAVACGPSRSVIYTGQHVQRTGVFDNPGKTPGRKELDPVATPTLGTMMREIGYRTAYIGKWHLSELPRGNHDHSSALRPFGFQEFVPALSDGDTIDAALEGMQRDASLASSAARWIAHNARAKGQDQPWFLAVNLINPHDIQYLDASGQQRKQVHPRFAEEMSDVPSRAPYTEDLGFPLPPSFPGPRERTIPAHRAYIEDAKYFYGDLPLTDTAAWMRYQNYYFNCLRDVDGAIGTVLDALEASGAAANTMIVFSSDHGEMGGAQGLRLKGPFIYKENFRVPLVIVHPDVRGASTTHALACAVDLAPTLLAAGGLDDAQRAERYPALKGRNLLPLLSSPDEGVRAALLFTSSIVHCCNPLKKQELVTMLRSLKPGERPPERRFPDDFVQVGERTFLRGVFDGRYKFGRYFAPSQHHRPMDWETLSRYNDLELYDTHGDPHELDNQASNPANRELLLRLNAQLNELLDREAGGDDGSYMPGGAAAWNLEA